MVGIKRSVAVVGFIAAIVAGGAAGVSAFGDLDPLPLPLPGPGAGAFTSFEIVGQDELTTFMVATVDPTLGGQILTVTFGPNADAGAIIAMVPLVPGTNLFPVPRSPVGGVYGASVGGEAKSVGSEEDGVN